MVIGSGGLSSVPPVLEAVRAGIPSVLLNPDAIPGRANRMLGSRVDAVFTQFEDTTAWFRRKERVLVTGCPIREAFNRASREKGIGRFRLDPDRRTLLITGASLGARNINEAVAALLPDLRKSEGWQILHLTGEADYEAVRSAYQTSGSDAKVLAYTEDMPDALAAADLVVSRAGASTLAELTAVGRASILMPYPYHRDQHQLANAGCLARAGAARIVPDRKTTRKNIPSLRAALEELMRNDGAREAMASAARRIGRGDAAARVAERIFAQINSSGQRSIETVKPSL